MHQLLRQKKHCTTECFISEFPDEWWSQTLETYYNMAVLQSCTSFCLVICTTKFPKCNAFLSLRLCDSYGCWLLTGVCHGPGCSYSSIYHIYSVNLIFLSVHSSFFTNGFFLHSTLTILSVLLILGLYRIFEPDRIMGQIDYSYSPEYCQDLEPEYG